MELFFLTVLCLCLSGCYGRVYHYPHADGVSRSDKFFITLSSTSHPKQSTFVYITTSAGRAQEVSHVHPNRTVSWTSFAFDGEPVTLEITTNTDFNTCVVRPKHYGFPCRRVGHKTAQVVVSANTRMMSVEFDYDDGTSGHSDVVDKLLIFADPRMHNSPGTNASHRMYYDAKVHDLHGQKLIENHVTEVYIAAGAYVHGAFKTAHNHPGVRIYGHGIISGERYAFHDPRISWALVLQDEGGHHVTEGVTLVNPSQYFLRALSANNRVTNVKTVGAWTYNTDGVALGPNGTLEDTFIMANDDAIKVYRDGLVANRCVVWQSHNGATFQFGWWNQRLLHHVRISDIDVIHTDWCAFKGSRCYTSPNAAVFSLSQGVRHFDVSDIELRNVRIEGVCPRIFKFEVPSNATGTIDDVRLIDWTVEKVSSYTSTLHNSIVGSSAIHLTDWKIINLKIANHCVRSAHDADMHVTGSTTDLSFFCGTTSPIIG